MPVRDRAPIGAPCWADLMTSDVEAARHFYPEVLGWTAEAPSEEFGGYFMFTRDGIPVAGGMPQMPGSKVPDMWQVYLCAGDAEATVARALDHGGSIAVPAMAVADLGTMAVVIDPTGASVGIWAPGTFPGFGVIDEAGAPKWFELHTRDYSRAVEFYTQVFGWEAMTMADTPEFRYSTAVREGEAFAGVLDASSFLPDHMPSNWVPYFGVADVDAAIAAVTGLGGVVLMGAEDTPYGRMATVTDSGRVPFRLMQAD